MSEHDSVECCEHGKAYATYVCRHLIEDDNTHWYSGDVDADNQWPDSWCGICNQFYEAEGGWNESSEAAAELSKNLKLLCHHCYQRIRSKCTVHRIEKLSLQCARVASDSASESDARKSSPNPSL